MRISYYIKPIWSIFSHSKSNFVLSAISVSISGINAGFKTFFLPSFLTVIIQSVEDNEPNVAVYFGVIPLKWAIFFYVIAALIGDGFLSSLSEMAFEPVASRIRYLAIHNYLKHLAEIPAEERKKIDEETQSSYLHKFYFCISDLMSQLITKVTPSLFDVANVTYWFLVLYGRTGAIGFSIILLTYIIFNVITAPIAKKAQEKFLASDKTALNFIANRIKNIDTLLMYDLVNGELKRAEEQNRITRVNRIKSHFIKDNIIVFRTIIIGVGSSVLLLVIQEHSLKQLMILLNCLYRLSGSLNTLGQSLSQIIENSPDLKTVIDFYNIPRINTKLDISRLNNNAENALEFENISFGYGKDHLLFKNAQLKIKPTELVCAVGSNGAGKTSLFIKLLFGKERPTEGFIKIYDYLINSPTLEDIPSIASIACVAPQERALIGGESIQFNIIEMAQLHEEKPTKEFWHAIKLAGMEGFFSNENTTQRKVRINNNDCNSSGSEMQRYVLLRAILKVLAKKIKILILDEALSNLNPALQNKMLAFIIRICKQNEVTLINITQRLETAKKFDKIYVIHDGVIDQDTHDELMKRNTWYKENYLAEIGSESAFVGEPELSNSNSNLMSNFRFFKQPINEKTPLLNSEIPVEINSGHVLHTSVTPAPKPWYQNCTIV